MLQDLKVEDIQFLELETREFKVMDSTYMAAMINLAKSSLPLKTFNSFWKGEGFNKKQIAVLRSALIKGIDLSKIARPHHSSGVLGTIVELIEKGVDVRPWLGVTERQLKLVIEIQAKAPDIYKQLTPAFDEKQLGYLSSIADTSSTCRIILNPLLSVDQMQAIWEAVQQGIYQADADTPSLSAKEIRELITANRISKLQEEFGLYPPEILKSIIEGDDKGVNLRPYVQEGFEEIQLGVVLKGLLAQVPVQLFANKSMEAADMSFLLKDLIYGRDISWYNQPNITLSLRKAIRDALVAGDIDNSVFCTLHSSLSRDERIKIFQEFLAREQKLRELNQTLKSNRNPSSIPTMSNFAPISKGIASTGGEAKPQASIDEARIRRVLPATTLDPAQKILQFYKENMLKGQRTFRNYLLPGEIEQENPVFVRLKAIRERELISPNYPSDTVALKDYIFSEIGFLIGLGYRYSYIEIMIGLMLLRKNYYSLLGIKNREGFLEKVESILRNTAQD